MKKTAKNKSLLREPPSGNDTGSRESGSRESGSRSRFAPGTADATHGDTSMTAQRKTEHPPFDMGLESRIDAFEAAKVKDSNTRVRQFVPPLDHPQYHQFVMELLRVDLEYAWEDGQREILEHYHREFPEFFAVPSHLETLAFEEFRLRRQAGEEIEPIEYVKRWGIATEQWPELPRAGSTFRPTDATAQADDLSGNTGADEYVLISRSTANSAAPLVPTYPKVGEPFAGFEILEELGRGAVGRVYFAKQADLANRPVVLKLSTEMWQESDRIARLQHTNIVPIYSVHRTGGLQAICMPYFGRITLATLVRGLQDTKVHERQPLNWSTIDSAHSERRSPDPTYESSCLRIALRLAEALAHAHERGIWHHDMKPANILLGDQGEPMLLDFNLSARSSDRDVMVAGGTVPYMAPEQIRALHKPTRIGAGCDLFGLGVVLYELLGGELPYGSENKWNKPALAQALERRSNVPSIRARNKAVSPGTESIIRRCLAPLPEQRYGSAIELCEDLRCQLEYRPLLHAPNRSIGERISKWSKRHPKVASLSALGLCSALLLVMLTSAWLWRGHQVRALTGLAHLEELESLIADVRAPLAARDDLIQTPLASAEETLARLEQGWEPFSSYADLREAIELEQRTRLDRARGELLFLSANAQWRLAAMAQPGEQSKQGIARAVALNRQASAAYSGSGVPVAVELQHDRLRAIQEGNELPGREGLQFAPSIDSSELALNAMEAMERGAFSLAVDQLERAKSADARDYNLWLLQGNCHRALGDLYLAELDFTSAAAILPRSFRPYFHRGLVRLDEKKYALAEEDFSYAMKLSPGTWEAQMNRAIARFQQGELVEALADLNQVESQVSAPTRLYFYRARIQRALGKHELAEADHLAGLRQVPSDEKDWIARALAQLPQNPNDSLTDLKRALEINPFSTQALQNLAHIHGEILRDPAAAAEILDQLLQIRPADPTALAGRAVMRARQQDREAALVDATAALRADQSAQTLYQVACVYALTSAIAPADSQQAVALLARAGEANKSWFAAAKDDPDLANLASNTQFRVLLEAAETLEGATKRGGAATIAKPLPSVVEADTK